MKKPLFEVIDFERDQSCDMLTVILKERNCYIPLRQFERWLDRTDRLNWVHDWSDHTGSHCQETGTYSISSYWDMSHKMIKADIYDFICIHFVDPFKTIKNSINEITRQYAK